MTSKIESENGNESGEQTITLSERGPIKIRCSEWPVIARRDRAEGGVIRVREHKDGRRIVYGYWTGWPRANRVTAGGFLLSAGADPDETVRAIRRVGGIFDNSVLAQECIDDLPAEALDGAVGAGKTCTMSMAVLVQYVSLLVRSAPYVPEELRLEIEATFAERLAALRLDAWREGDVP